ncbi:HK97-gp10 family putative phage morphogenesis protein [Ammoniphilus sp. YIM 78166]|uniref:HK97-gp10 family putative phage morphogenesis protein n=1 Tax=Ammoniphilus sp. YIM 78166 TaxID=1644106 RepID=UPI00106F0A6D|nr:HK97-gp10 family putative phage morphogenesis protein [Ammoniphilus sp. YIM 78166]
MPRPIRNRGFFSTEVRGLEAALAEFERYSSDVQTNVKDVVADSASKISTNAKSKVAVDQGETKNSIKPIVFNEGYSATIGPRLPKGWKAHWIEFGTNPRYTKKKGKMWNGIRYTKGKIAYTGEMPAMPFLSPAFEEEKPGYISDLRKAMRDPL